MIKPRPAPLALLVALLLPAAAPALADYTLDGDSARVNFVSTKAGNVAEVHAFGDVSGSLADDGSAQIVIELASVETAIAIRNERMRKMLFEIADFPRATIRAQLDAARYAELDAGETVSFEAPATLALHGREKELTIAFTVVATADGGLLVSSAQPIVVNAADFGLTAGVEALREVAGLPSISPAVPVTFVLHFSAV